MTEGLIGAVLLQLTMTNCILSTSFVKLFILQDTTPNL